MKGKLRIPGGDFCKLSSIATDLSIRLYIEASPPVALEKSTAFKMGKMAGEKGIVTGSNIYDPKQMFKSFQRFEIGRKAGLANRLI